MKKQTLVKEICPTTTQVWVKNGALLVDVREADELAELAFDVPDILHIPLGEFDIRYTEIPKDRDVVVVCKHGVRSLRAAGFLVNHGYDKAVNMKHGIVRWVQKGFPTKGDPSSVLENAADTGCCGPTKTETEKTTQSCCGSSPKPESNCC